MPIENSSRNTRIAKHVDVADSSFKRMKGLLGKDTLESNSALLITACNSIHMFFMKFAIDVIFIDKTHKVVGLSENIRPFMLSPIFWRASCAIELPVGTIKATQTQVGDQLQIS